MVDVACGAAIGHGPWAMDPRTPRALSVGVSAIDGPPGLAGLSPAYSTRYTHCTRPPALHTGLDMNTAKTKNKNKRASPVASAWLANRGRQGIAYSWWIIMAPFTTLAGTWSFLQRFLSSPPPGRPPPAMSLASVL
jgi:hypothetical protein